MIERAAIELDHLWAALMFYTRIPVPQTALHSQEVLNRSRKYFPLVGVLIGIIAASVFALANLVLGIALSVALSMAATILATGAFHEDGFADSCDGLGGGWTHEQMLSIMKDSRVGTYATVGLFLLLCTKLLVLIEIATNVSLLTFTLTYITGHTLSRQLSSMVIESHEYVQDLDQSKVKPITEQHLSYSDHAISLATTLTPLIILALISTAATIIGLLVALTSAKLFMRYCRKRLGGYTGDILGANQQLSEVAFYLALGATL